MYSTVAICYISSRICHKTQKIGKKGGDIQKDVTKLLKSFIIFNAIKIAILLHDFLLQISRLFTVSRIALLYMRNGVTVA